MIVKGFLHRSVFRPLAKLGLPSALCSLGAFFVSGVFHEFALHAAFGIVGYHMVLGFIDLDNHQ